MKREYKNKLKITWYFYMYINKCIYMLPVTVTRVTQHAVVVNSDLTSSGSRLHSHHIHYAHSLSRAECSRDFDVKLTLSLLRLPLVIGSPLHE